MEGENAIVAIEKAIQYDNEELLFEVLVENYKYYLGSIITRIYQDQLDPAISKDDILQEVFLRLKKAGGIKKFSLESIVTIKDYLAAITRNTCFEYLKKSSRNKEHILFRKEPETEEIKIPPDDDRFHFTDEMENALSKLSAVQRQIFRLHIIGGYTFEEIAQQIDKNLSNVKYHFYAAKEKLKKLLECSRE